MAPARRARWRCAMRSPLGSVRSPTRISNGSIHRLRRYHRFRFYRYAVYVICVICGLVSTMTTTPRVMIAAPMSGSGKTTVTAGLIAALAARRLRVAPFKVGPDYIDPSYHRRAAGRACHNLDTWMLAEDQAVALLARHTQGVDLALIEG